MYTKTSFINRYFDQVYVLNLESRPDRKVAMIQKLSRMGIKAEFVQAVNGNSYQNKLEHQTYLEKPIGAAGSHPLEVSQQRKLISSPGAWGYLKTYYGILQDAKKRDFERILCFDDDVLFHKDFENRFRSAISTIPDQWKLLYLGASQYVWNTPQGLSFPKSSSESQSPFYFPNNTDGSFALGLNVSVFDMLMRDILSMDCPFDSGALKTVIKAYPEECFVLNPNLVIADGSESDIREGQNQAQLAEQLKWDMANYDFPVHRGLVSVIMPAYNAEKTIEKSIRSVLMQSYSALELIVVDDASSDNTIGIVKNLMGEDSRIQLISLPENGGVGAARNEGIKASKGTIIAFQDADDISLRDRLAYQLAPIYETGMMFSICRFYRSRCTIDDLDLNDQVATMALVESRRVKNKDGLYEYRDRAELGLVTIMYQRCVFEKFGLFEEHRFGEDMEYVERILHEISKRKFDDTYNGHSFLTENARIIKLYKRIEKPLYISPEMDENNLTNQYQKKGKEKKKILKAFRKKYRSESLDQYPKLSLQDTRTDLGAIRYNTLILDSFVLLPEVEHLMLLGAVEKAEEAEENNTSLVKVYDSLSWKITAPLRWIRRILIKMFRFLK